ncbi:E3 ubiquitin-protein ligase Rnf220-like isoform X2 [Oscarella lobularis]|uniref:E3 ubiquitin-protein ligase Rnf220-like isoform X2 n=1 Tax=Oscarella lobularis TaxID=121494 RepID=UPI003313B415
MTEKTETPTSAPAPAMRSSLRQKNKAVLDSPASAAAVAVDFDLRPRRDRKKCTFTGLGSSVQCPICDVFLKPSDLQKHWHVEQCRLQESDSHAKLKRRRKRAVGSASEEPRNDDGETQALATVRAKRALECIQRNKYKRSLRVPTTSPSGLPTCPICSRVIDGDANAVNEHIDECLGSSSSAPSPVADGSDANDFEEYTWAGETRVRATTMIPTSLLSDQRLSAGGDEDTVLDIEGDGGALGKVQYTEADLIPCKADEPSEERQRQALRGAVISNLPQRSLDSSLGVSNEGPGSQATRCLVCMDSFQTPVVSVNCWHVFCEVCWLRALGAKKLCPKCNSITAPGDLRKIYI